MSNVTAKVVCHSESPQGQQIVTLEVNFHRSILAEVNTHKALSRNYQSSRAVPVLRMLEQVINNPAMPVQWGLNKAGMQADEEISPELISTAEMVWRDAAKDAAKHAEHLKALGVHKQVTNRLLEPFIWTKGVLTATLGGWEAIFKLRCHPAAQPEFQELAMVIEKAIRESTPNKLRYGDWHMPYVKIVKDELRDQRFIANREEGGKFLSLLNAVKISNSCTAQVSYRNLDDSLEKALEVYNMLNLPSNGVLNEDPPHFSTAEHQILCTKQRGDLLSGNLHSSEFVQFRRMLEVGIEKVYLGGEYE